AVVTSFLAAVSLFAKSPGCSFVKVATFPYATLFRSFGFSATVDGTYAFYTRAHDAAGNYEAAPASADSSTFVDTSAPTSSASSQTGRAHACIPVTSSASNPTSDCNNNGLPNVDLWAK